MSESFKFFQTIVSSIERHNTDSINSISPRSDTRLRRVSQHQRCWNIFQIELIHEQLPLPVPCYDLVPVTELTLGPPYRDTSGTPGSLDLTGGEYKTWERIHRGLADPRLLAIPTSWSRVSDSNPNWGHFWRLAQSHLVAARCNGHCIMCVAQGIKGTCWPGVILSFLPHRSE